MNSSKVIKVLQELEDYKLKKRRLWNVSWEVGEFLNFCSISYKCKNILEIGMSNGFSTIWLAKDLPKNGKVVSIESREEHVIVAKENFKKSELNNIDVIEGVALDVLINIKDEFDMIFIDANKSQYIDYIKILERNGCIGNETLIIADNVVSHEHNVGEYLEYVKKNYKTIILNIDAGLSLSVKK